MTAKEAIENIKIAVAEVEWEYPMGYAAAFDMAVEALEKQIPKKPKLHEENKFSASCPSCNGDVPTHFIQGGVSWCEYCGQAIDWGGANENRND